MSSKFLRIFWIKAATAAPGRLAVMPRPMPHQFDDLKREGVDVVVSMMEAGEAVELGLGDEVGLCSRSGMEFLNLPIIDHGVPSAVTPVTRLSRQITSHLQAGKGVAVHCFAGLGRSPLMCAAVLIDHGLGAIEACDLISEARGTGVPEMSQQADWLVEYERRQRGL